MSEYPHNSIREVFESFLIFDFTEELLTEIVNECGRFLVVKKGIKPNIVENLSVEFLISSDFSLIEVFGGNLMSTLWIINIFPPDPEKYIKQHECIFQDKQYIYNPSKKTLKIKKCSRKKR